MGEWQGTRRQLLGASGTVGAAAIAGCEGLVAGDGDPSTESASPTATVGEGQSASPVLAAATATLVENWRQVRVETAKRLAGAEQIESGTDEERQQHLSTEYNDLTDAVYRVDFVDLDSATVVASTERSKVDQLLVTREAPWQNEPLDYGEDGVFVSEATEARRRSLLSVVVPVDTDADGQFVIVLQADLDVLGTELPTAGEEFTQIVDYAGRVVSDSQQASALGRNNGELSEYAGGVDAPALQRGLDGESGTVTQTQPAENGDGEREYRVAFAPVASAEWAVLVHEPL